MKSKTRLIFISLFLMITMAFVTSAVTYKDDFEGYLNETMLKRDYQVWESGALLEIFLEDEMVNSGGKALGVEVVSPNPVNKTIYGSVYRTLELFQGNWSGGVGMGFWVSNPNETALQLSVNFKERHREYWAVADEGVFYFQSADGVVSQQEIYYSSLLIPPYFSGFVILPFTSFAVPDWNTAKSNQVIDLNRIESYAFSVLAGENTPFIFTIDDFEIFGQTNFYKIFVEGLANVQIPPSGELLETFSAEVRSFDHQVVEAASVNWSIEAPYDLNLRISEDGVLQIPAEAQPGEITLTAAWRTSDFTLTKSFEVSLSGADTPGFERTPAPNPMPPAVAPYSAYDQFSTQFDAWTTENRPLFVGLLIFGVVGFLTILSTIEHKLK